MTQVMGRKMAFLPAALLSVVLLAGTASAQSAATGKKDAPGSPAGSPAANSYSTPERVEARITELHTKLGIVAAQETLWTNLTDTMRDNAQAIEEASTAREKSLKSMTVMDDLKSYEALASAHAEGLHKLVAAFGPLYDSMSVEQRAAADKEFQGYRERLASQQ